MRACTRGRARQKLTARAEAWWSSFIRVLEQRTRYYCNGAARMQAGVGRCDSRPASAAGDGPSNSRAKATCFAPRSKARWARFIPSLVRAVDDKAADLERTL